jgi:hypothetical protein
MKRVYFSGIVTKIPIACGGSSPRYLFPSNLSNVKYIDHNYISFNHDDNILTKDKNWSMSCFEYNFARGVKHTILDFDSQIYKSYKNYQTTLLYYGWKYFPCHVNSFYYKEQCLDTNQFIQSDTKLREHLAQYYNLKVNRLYEFPDTGLLGKYFIGDGIFESKECEIK